MAECSTHTYAQRIQAHAQHSARPAAQAASSMSLSITPRTSWLRLVNEASVAPTDRIGSSSKQTFQGVDVHSSASIRLALRKVTAHRCPRTSPTPSFPRNSTDTIFSAVRDDFRSPPFAPPRRRPSRCCWRPCRERPKHPCLRPLRPAQCRAPGYRCRPTSSVGRSAA